MDIHIDTHIYMCSFIHGDFLDFTLRPQYTELIGEILCAMIISSDSIFSLVIQRTANIKIQDTKSTTKYTKHWHGN